MIHKESKIPQNDTSFYSYSNDIAFQSSVSTHNRCNNFASFWVDLINDPHCNKYLEFHGIFFALRDLELIWLNFFFVAHLTVVCRLRNLVLLFTLSFSI